MKKYIAVTNMTQNQNNCFGYFLVPKYFRIKFKSCPNGTNILPNLVTLLTNVGAISLVFNQFARSANSRFVSEASEFWKWSIVAQEDNRVQARGGNKPDLFEPQPKLSSLSPSQAQISHNKQPVLIDEPGLFKLSSFEPCILASSKATWSYQINSLVKPKNWPDLIWAGIVVIIYKPEPSLVPTLHNIC